MEVVITDSNFEKEVLQSNKVVLVDFWASWCGPCQYMGPIVAELAEEYKNKDVIVGKVNVDDNPITSGNYSVMSIPTFLLFKGGQVVDQTIGMVSKEKLKEMIEKHL